jgi:hypothetical protein
MSQVLIQQYPNQLQDLRKVSATSRESVVREAFKDLFKGWARSRDLNFVSGIASEAQDYRQQPFGAGMDSRPIQRKTPKGPTIRETFNTCPSPATKKKSSTCSFA